MEMYFMMTFLLNFNTSQPKNGKSQLSSFHKKKKSKYILGLGPTNCSV